MGKRKRKADTSKDEQDDFVGLLNAAEKAIRELRLEKERSVRENKDVKKLVEKKDTRIKSLNDLVIQMTHACSDEMMDLALEAQASQALAMIQSLQEDVAAKNVEIADLKDHVEKIMNQQRLDWQQQRQADCGRWEAIVEADQRTVQAKGIAHEQERLITKLRDENARLGTV